MDETTVGVFAYNELVFVGRRGLKVTTLRDVLRLKNIAIGSPKSVSHAGMHVCYERLEMRHMGEQTVPDEKNMADDKTEEDGREDGNRFLNASGV